MITTQQGDTAGRSIITLTDNVDGFGELSGATAIQFEFVHRVRGLELTIDGQIDDAGASIVSWAITDMSSLAVGVYLPTAMVTYGGSGLARFTCDEVRIAKWYDGNET